jgi:hypothetical protein
MVCCKIEALKIQATAFQTSYSKSRAFLIEIYLERMSASQRKTDTAPTSLPCSETFSSVLKQRATTTREGPVCSNKEQCLETNSHDCKGVANSLTIEGHSLAVVAHHHLASSMRSWLIILMSWKPIVSMTRIITDPVFAFYRILEAL